MIAADTMTFLFDPAKAMEKLETIEKDWGGPPAERMARQMAAYKLAKAIEKGQAPPAEATNAMNVAESNGAAAAPSLPPASPTAPAADADDAPPPADSAP